MTNIIPRIVAKVTQGQCTITRLRRYIRQADHSSGPGASAIPKVPVEFSIAGPERFEAYLALGEDTADRLAPRLANGDRLVLGVRAGQICYFGWIRLRPHSERTCSARAAHIYKCFTTPSCRGLGVYPAGLRFSLTWLTQAGVSDVTIDVSEENAPSIRGIEKAGFQLLGRWTLVCLGSRRTLIMPARLRVYGDSP